MNKKPLGFMISTTGRVCLPVLKYSDNSVWLPSGERQMSDSSPVNVCLVLINPLRVTRFIYFLNLADNID